MREYECVRMAPENGFLHPDDVKAATRDAIPVTKLLASSGVDLAFLHDACGQVITERQGDLVAVTLVDLVPSPSVPSETRKRFADQAIAHGARYMAADVHEWSTTAEYMTALGIQFTKAPTAASRDAAFGLMRRLFRERKILIPNDPRLIKQLLALRSDPTPSGALGIDLPRGPSGHCDLVAALLSALWLDRRHGPVGLTLTPIAPVRSAWTAQ
jgi:hypothetical protein